MEYGQSRRKGVRNRVKSQFELTKRKPTESKHRTPRLLQKILREAHAPVVEKLSGVNKTLPLIHFYLAKVPSSSEQLSVRTVTLPSILKLCDVSFLT